MLKSHKELIVWQRAMELAEEVYKLSAQLPTDERFGLVSQIRRAAVSVPSNIAEGFSRKRTGDYLRFLSIADGSVAEIETQLILAYRLHGADINRAEELVIEVQKMLTVLIRKLTPNA